MSLVVRRNEGETWRECVQRVAGKYGLEGECLDIFDADVAVGTDEGTAAWGALYEWDCLDYEPNSPEIPDSSNPTPALQVGNPGE